jgi:(p)ppGpp synthase/HD superfamily hydrolase
VIHAENRRIEIQIRTPDMHEEAELGLAAHWAYKQANAHPEAQVSWIRDLVEILDNAESPEELLEHTRMAMYQDRIFAFTPKGELHQLPKGATPIDFAYAVHTDLGDQAVGAKVNGRVVPLRTIIANGDQVQILRSKAQHPQASWMNFAITGKARAAIRRFLRQTEREETHALGRKLYDEVVSRLPAPLGAEAIKVALTRLKLADEAALMEAIARRRITDAEVMEALMPGSVQASGQQQAPAQTKAISIRGLTPGVAYDLAECCHPVPGDRIVGLRRPDQGIEVHVIECPVLATADDADWVDLAWGDKTEGGTARIAVGVKNEPGSLGTIATIIGGQKANIVNMRLDNRDSGFHTNTFDVEVHDTQHLMRLIAALRAADAVSGVERI